MLVNYFFFFNASGVMLQLFINGVILLEKQATSVMKKLLVIDNGIVSSWFNHANLEAKFGE